LLVKVKNGWKFAVQTKRKVGGGHRIAGRMGPQIGAEA
jgi:hypothetical protein